MHGPVQELLVEQDAVDVLHCGSTQKKRLSGPGDESAVLIIVLYTSSVLVTVLKKKLIQTGKSLWPFPGILGSFAGSRLFLPKLEVEMKKRRSVIILAPMVEQRERQRDPHEA